MTRFVHLQWHIGTVNRFDLILNAERITAISKVEGDPDNQVNIYTDKDCFVVYGYTLVELLCILGIQPTG